MNDTRYAWAVFSNTDRTEGRGREYITCICDVAATAMRKAKGAGVQGMDADVRKIELVKHNNKWYGPVNIESPTHADIDAQVRIEIKNAALEKAKNLGLTDQDIAALKL